MTSGDGGLLLVLAIVLPAIGVVVSLGLGGRRAEIVTQALLPVQLLIAALVAATMLRSGHAIDYHLGGLPPPLGITLRADGFSAVMMLMSAVVLCATALFARGSFATRRGEAERRASLVFWTLLTVMSGALNAVFLGSDLFTLYVALELLTFGAVPLVSLDGRAETLTAALRYLLFALVGSVLYLLGAALIYGGYGTLDIGLLHGRVRPGMVSAVALALMTLGLLAKTALFPLHLWLPPAHAGAPPAASAVLSALVVKGSFFLVVRLWFSVMPAVATQAGAQILAAMGGAAILVGSVVALRQARLKLLIAYSTVAQIGYLFLMFPLAIGGAGAGFWDAGAWAGGIMQAVSHGVAKAAMFMAAGLMAEALGHDRIAELRGIGRVLPLTVIAFALAGLSLMGVPPSGGFLAKWLLLRAAAVSGQWWWAAVILLGGLLAGGYVFRVLSHAMADAAEDVPLRARVPRRRQMVVLALAVCSVLLGLLPLTPFHLLRVDRPPAAVTGFR